MIKRLASLLVCLCAMYLAGVASAQDKSLKKFHWGVTSLSASQWIPWIAKEAKLYEKHGMEAERTHPGRAVFAHAVRSLAAHILASEIITAIAAIV